ncbi:MAG: histidine kinase [Burkholderiales bacterium]|nr:histidine kinase [Burkholderiales bacterium]
MTDADTAAREHGGYKIPALRALSEITTSLSTDSDLEDLLERFLSTMVKLAGAIGGAVRVATPDGTHLRLVGAIGLPQEVIEREQYVPLECGICGKAAHTQTIESAETSVCRENTALAYFGDTCKRVIAIPLRNKGRIMGVYNLFLSGDNPVPDDVSLLFSSISEHLGMALENARLTRENIRITLMSERQMLANEIHDSLAQTLAYMKMRLAFLNEAINTGDDPLAKKYLGEVDDAMESAYSRLRELLTQFRHRMDPRGLIPALQDVADNFSRLSGIKAAFVNRVPDMNLTPDQEVQVFHIVQEALANVSKHARARQVRICADMTADQYMVTINDDGIGLTGPGNTGIGMRLGMNIMRERAQRLGGSIDVASQAGEGTRIQLKFPVSGQRRPVKA